MKSSVIQEALFNRIQILETQVAKASADKDAVQQGLIRLIDVQAVARFQGIETPPSSLRFDNSTGGGSTDSPASSSQHNLAQCHGPAVSSNNDNALIDLLGPIEQQPVKASNEIVDPFACKKNLEICVTSDSKGDLDHSFAVDDNNALPYVRHFVEKAPEPTSNTVSGGQPITIVGPTTPERIRCARKATMVASPGLAKSILPNKQEEDSENPMLGNGVTSMTASCSSLDNNTPKSLSSRKNDADSEPRENPCVAIEQVLETEANLMPSVETEYSKWSSTYQGPRLTRKILSPEERWEKDCTNTFIKGPRRSLDELSKPAPVDIDDAVIVEHEGQAAKLNRFRYRNVCNLCFNPQDGEQGVYRTVLVSKLPKDSTTIDLLDKIKGGAIFDAKMLDTHAITGYKSALLTFIEGSQAMDLEEHAFRHPLSIDGQVVEISLVEVPTRPISLQLALDISKNKCTRCLYVHKFPRHIPPQQLRHDLRPDPVCKLDFIESMVMSADNVLELRFFSVAAAMKAFHLLKSIAKYRKCNIEYGLDICAEPWETSKLTKMVKDDVVHLDIIKSTEDGSLNKDDKA